MIRTTKPKKKKLKKKPENYDSLRKDKKRISLPTNEETTELDKVIRRCMKKTFPESGTSRFVVKRNII